MIWLYHSSDIGLFHHVLFPIEENPGVDVFQSSHSISSHKKHIWSPGLSHTLKQQLVGIIAERNRSFLLMGGEKPYSSGEVLNVCSIPDKSSTTYWIVEAEKACLVNLLQRETSLLSIAGWRHLSQNVFRHRWSFPISAMSSLPYPGHIWLNWNFPRAHNYR